VGLRGEGERDGRKGGQRGRVSRFVTAEEWEKKKKEKERINRMGGEPPLNNQEKKKSGGSKAIKNKDPMGKCRVGGMVVVYSKSGGSVSNRPKE